MSDVRPARPDDAEGMARVHVQAWQETYRGVMPDAMLDDPEAPARRRRMWEAVLTDEQYAGNAVAVAEHAGRIVGIAMAGPPGDDADDGTGGKGVAEEGVGQEGVAEAGVGQAGVGVAGAGLEGARELHVLYVLAAHHGTGLGRRLLQATIPEGTAATLWVADPNPRAQAFYRAAGFVPDGVTKVEEGVRHLHLTRPAATPRAARPEGTDGATA